MSTALPVGLEVVRPPFAEISMLRAARAFEASAPFSPPDLPKPRRQPG
jgi:Asp-tRNA(Asn)/Glu-tRNA(Gln) amidotransferase A subunit family amidase